MSGSAAGPTWPPSTWPARSCCWRRSRSRPGSPWPRWRGRGGTTRSPPGWAGSRPPHRSPSTPASGNARSAPPSGLTDAPGAVPLLARGGRIPVGGTIRAIGHRWHPVFTIPAAACARHMVIVGATGSGKTNLMMRLWAGWFTATLAAGAGRERAPAAAGRAGLQGRPGRPPQGRPDPPPALRSGRPPRRDLAR